MSNLIKLFAMLVLTSPFALAGEKISLKVEGMTCGNCVRKVTNKVCQLPGVKEGSCQVEVGKVDLEIESPLTRAMVEKAITDAHYKVVN